jgi:hypothetical protein
MINSCATTILWPVAHLSNIKPSNSPEVQYLACDSQLSSRNDVSDEVMKPCCSQKMAIVCGCSICFMAHVTNGPLYQSHFEWVTSQMALSCK